MIANLLFDLIRIFTTQRRDTGATFSLIAIISMHAAAVVAQPTPVIPAGHAEQAVLQSMYVSGLHDSAIAYCRAQKKWVEESSDAEARWTMWEIQSLGEKASQAPLAQAAPIWAEAMESVEAFRQLQPPRPRTLWVRWQGEVSQLLRTQVALARWLAVPSDNNLQAEIITQVRDNLDRLEVLRRDISEQVQLAAGRPASHSPSSAELSLLEIEVSLLEAESLLVRHKCYAAGSADAIAAASEMLDRVRQASTRVASQWSGQARLDLAKAIALSQLGRDDEALPILKLLANDSDNNISNRAAAITAFIYQTTGQLSSAQQILNSRGTWESSPELAIAHLNWMLAEIKEIKSRNNQSTDTKAALDTKFREALDLRSAIGQRFGGYWQQRAEAALVAFSGESAGPNTNNSAPATNANTAIELLLVEVKQLLAADRWQDAIASLDRGVQIAKSAGDQLQGMQLSSVAAALAQQKQDWPQARLRFEKAAKDFPDHPTAAQALLTAAWCASQELSDNSNVNDRVVLAENYTSLLFSHLELFPESTERFTAAEWLSAWYRSQNQFEQSVKIWQIVAATEPDGKISLPNLMQDWLAIAWSPSIPHPNRIRELESAQQWLQKLIDDPLRDISIKRRFENLHEALRQLVPRGILPESSPTYQFQTAEQPEDTEACIVAFADLEQKLKITAVRSSGESGATTDVDRIVKSTAAQKIPASIRTAILSSAIELLDSTNPKNRQTLLPVLINLATWQKDLATNPETAQAKVFEYRLLSWQGDTEKSDTNFESLRSTSPRDPWLAIQHSYHLIDRREPDFNQAIGILRQLAAGTKPGQWPWVEARLQTVMLLRWQGETEKAEQLAKLVLATEANLPSTWKELFQQQIETKR